MTWIMQVYAHCSKKFRNYACAFYIKFGKNTSITMQQTSIWQKKKTMGFRVSYAHASTPVERGLGLFQ